MSLYTVRSGMGCAPAQGFLGLGQLQSADSATAEILSRMAAGSSLVNGSISRAGYLTAKHPLDPGNIQTALWSLFQGTAESYGPAPSCRMYASTDPNVADQNRCGVFVDPSGQTYFAAWLKFLQSAPARAEVFKWVSYKLNDLAGRAAGTIGTPESIAESNRIADQNVAASLARAKAEEAAAIAAIRAQQGGGAPASIVAAPDASGATIVPATATPETAVRDRRCPMLYPLAYLDPASGQLNCYAADRGVDTHKRATYGYEFDDAPGAGIDPRYQAPAAGARVIDGGSLPMSTGETMVANGAAAAYADPFGGGFSAGGDGAGGGEWIDGVPNWAVFGAAALAGLVVFSSGRRR